MKLIVLGFGQCGGRIADEFERLNRRAHSLRGIDIIVDSFAINTDSADLAGLYSIKPTYQHRILEVVSALDLPIDILKNNDRVVDNTANGHSQAGQGHDIEREIEWKQSDGRRDNRLKNRYAVHQVAKRIERDVGRRWQPLQGDKCHEHR